MTDAPQGKRVERLLSTAETENTSAKHWARASIVNSLLLFTAAALQLNATFWVLVVTNFALLHAVWLVQLVRRRHSGAVDSGYVNGPSLPSACWAMPHCSCGSSPCSLVSVRFPPKPVMTIATQRPIVANS